jgi:hypothetical protein
MEKTNYWLSKNISSERRVCEKQSTDRNCGRTVLVDSLLFHTEEEIKEET